MKKLIINTLIFYLVFGNSVNALEPGKWDFVKENEDCLDVVGLIFDGDFFEADKYKQFADLPSKDELLTKFVVGLNSPMTKVAQCLKSSMSNFVNVLNSLKEIK